MCVCGGGGLGRRSSCFWRQQEENAGRSMITKCLCGEGGMVRKLAVRSGGGGGGVGDGKQQEEEEAPAGE